MPAPLAGRLIAVLATLAAILTPLPVSAASASAAAPEQEPDVRADYVIVVGVPGLRWEDLDQRRTPTLWHLAEQADRGAFGRHLGGQV
jgi:hypothetical protein